MADRAAVHASPTMTDLFGLYLERHARLPAMVRRRS
jgi:hypothetical protein